MSEGRSSALLTCLFCLAWAAAMLWPALAAPRDRIVMDIGDPVLNASILEWNARTLPLTHEWWNFPAFAPAAGITAFTEHLLGLYPVATPLRWLTGHPVVTYDVLCVLSFPLTAAGMFVFARRLTGSSIAAFVGAIAFTFAPYRISHLSHVQMLWAFGIPLALLGLHQWVDDRARRGLALFAAGWLVTAASNGYLMVFFGIYVLLWVAWSCSTRSAVDRLPGIAASGILATLPLVPLLLGYVDVHRRYGLQRSAAEVASYGADLTGILRPWAGAGFVWPWLEPTVGEGAIFPGLAIVALAIAGAFTRARGRSAEPRRSPWVSRTLLTASAVFFAAAACAWLTDVRYDLGFVRLSLSNPSKPLTIGLAALVVGIATSPPVEAVLRARSPRLFHALMVPVLWVLSLGPVGRVNGVEVVPGLPYEWLLSVPGMTALRVPARFWLLGTFSLAVLAAYGAARLVTRARAGRSMLAGQVMTFVLVALMLLEGWAIVAGSPVVSVPAVEPEATHGGPVLELPLEYVEQNSTAVLRAVRGGYRTINGYSGFEPPHFAPLRFGIGVRDAGVLNELRRWTPFHVSLRSDDSDGLRTWVTRTQPDARLVSESGGRALYAVPRQDRAQSADESSRGVGSALPFTIARASCGHALLPDLRDGSLATRWECGPGRPGQFVEADLGRVRSVSAIVNSLGRYISDAPRALRIAVSDDGDRWTTAWEGPTAALALRAALERPARMDVYVPFDPVRARYVRITQTGAETQWLWSVAELSIIGDS